MPALSVGHSTFTRCMPRCGVRENPPEVIDLSVAQAGAEHTLLLWICILCQIKDGDLFGVLAESPVPDAPPSPAHPHPQIPVHPVSIPRERRCSAPLPLVPGRRQTPTPLFPTRVFPTRAGYRTTNAVSALLLDSNGTVLLLGENRALTVCAPAPSSALQTA